MGRDYKSDFETSYVGAFWKVRKACRYVVEANEGQEGDGEGADGVEGMGKGREKGVYVFPETDKRGRRHVVERSI
jgi:omega-6 fatty acid desaturase (delta-12 desaturase)